MASRWRGPEGWQVDIVRLGRRSYLHVRYLGFHVAYCGTVAELEDVLAERGLGLADLVEVFRLPTRRG